MFTEQVSFVGPSIRAWPFRHQASVQFQSTKTWLNFFEQTSMKQQKKLIVLLPPLVIVAVSISLSFIHFLEQQAIKSLILFIVFFARLSFEVNLQVSRTFKGSSHKSLGGVCREGLKGFCFTKLSQSLTLFGLRRPAPVLSFAHVDLVCV